MADLAPDATQVSRVEGAVCLPYLAGGTVEIGDAVYLDSAGKVQRADADALASSQAIGIVVGVGIHGYTTAAANTMVTVCIWGRVFLGDAIAMTVPGRVYVSTTAGKMDQTAPAAQGDYPFQLGRADSATVIFVDPQYLTPTVNP